MKAHFIALFAVSGLVAAVPAQAQSAAQAAYDAQLRAYQRQQDDYQRARASYDADMRRYQDDTASYNGDYGPSDVPADFVPAAYVPFESLTRIRDQVLVSKPVQTLEGIYVGRVSDIRLTGGLVTQMQVRINSARVTWVNSSRMRYDEAADIVVTDLTADQMAGRSRIDW